MTDKIASAAMAAAATNPAMREWVQKLITKRDTLQHQVDELNQYITDVTDEITRT